ncbi:MAG: hypothetical protein WCK42_07670 [Myxococcaceae bacterium]
MKLKQFAIGCLMFSTASATPVLETLTDSEQRAVALQVAVLLQACSRTLIEDANVMSAELLELFTEAQAATEAGDWYIALIRLSIVKLKELNLLAKMEAAGLLQNVTRIKLAEVEHLSDL